MDQDIFKISSFRDGAKEVSSEVFRILSPLPSIFPLILKIFQGLEGRGDGIPNTPLIRKALKLPFISSAQNL